MQITIHRGINQIGGCITEISTDTSRIFIDMGTNLPGVGEKLSTDEEKGIVNNLLSQNKRDQEAIFFTHSHPDHTGMLAWVSEGMECFMSKGTKDILRIKTELLIQKNELCKTETGITNEEEEKDLLMLQKLHTCHEWKRPEPRHKPQTITVGDIKVTPYFVSHSTYDASMLLIEVSGKRILHTGDFRGHGFLSKGLFPTLNHYIRQVDVLITEGTMLSRNDVCETEQEISRRMAEVMKKYKYIFVLASSTDIERLTAVHLAAKKADKTLMCCSGMHSKAMDYFKKESGFRLCEFSYKFYSFYKPDNSVLEGMKDKGFTMVFGSSYGDKIKKLKEEFNPDQTLLIYSTWEGYYTIPEQVEANPEYKKIRDMFTNVVDIHTSGHADAGTITEVIKTVNPREAIIGIHKDKETSLTSLTLPEELMGKIIPERMELDYITVY